MARKSWAPPLQKLSTWSELIGYFGSVALKTREMEKINASIEAKKEEADDDGMDLKRLNAELEFKKTINCTCKTRRMV